MKLQITVYYRIAIKHAEGSTTQYLPRTRTITRHITDEEAHALRLGEHKQDAVRDEADHFVKAEYAIRYGRNNSIEIGTILLNLIESI